MESKLIFTIMIRYPKDRLEDDPNGFGSKVVTASPSMDTINNVFIPMIYDLVGNIASAKLYAFDLSGKQQISFTLWDEEANIQVEDVKSRFMAWLGFVQQYEPIQANLLISFLNAVKNSYNARVIDDNAINTWNDIKKVVAGRFKNAADYTALITILEHERTKLGGETNE